MYERIGKAEVALANNDIKTAAQVIDALSKELIAMDAGLPPSRNYSNQPPEIVMWTISFGTRLEAAERKQGLFTAVFR
jgi:hypothetical protein